MVIKSKTDLKRFITCDSRRNHIHYGWKYFFYLFLGRENARVFHYLYVMRKAEYYLNNSNKVVFKLLYYYYRFRKLRLGAKYNIYIPLNCAGPGLYIPHIRVGGVILSARQIGSNCTFNSGCMLGNKKSANDLPSIGDNVVFNPGAKAFGDIKISDNVIVAPNAVVTKDIESFVIVGGVPARIIKQIGNVPSNGKI